MGSKTKLNGILTVAICSLTFVGINTAKADSNIDANQAVNLVRNNSKSSSDAAGVGVQSYKAKSSKGDKVSEKTDNDDFSPLAVLKRENKTKKETSYQEAPQKAVAAKPVLMASVEKNVASSPAANKNLGGKAEVKYISEADMMNELGMKTVATNSIDIGGYESDVRPADVAAYQKIGSPYQVNGKWYIPAHEPDYDETGMASWYGDQFHGKQTANGEIFNMNEITIAHPTLPIPCLVEVTNIENGRSVVARVNDRGPFASDRLIDVSKRGAEVLGFKDKGTAKVRVRYIGAAPKLDTPKTQLASLSTTKTFDVPVSSPANNVVTTTISAPVKAKTIVTAAPKLSSGMFLQIGSFSSRDNAERMKKEKSSYGDINIAEVETNTGKLYRVLVGPFVDASTVNQKKAELLDAGFSGVRVINSAD